MYYLYFFLIINISWNLDLGHGSEFDEVDSEDDHIEVDSENDHVEWHLRVSVSERDNERDHSRRIPFRDDSYYRRRIPFRDDSHRRRIPFRDVSYDVEWTEDIKERFTEETADDDQYYDSSKRRRAIGDTIPRNNIPDNLDICRKKRQAGIGWKCEAMSSCQFAPRLIALKNVTVCGGDGSSQKICCPYRIDPIKAAQEKCREYLEFRYINKRVGGAIFLEKPVTKRVLDCVNDVQTLIVGGVRAKEKEFPHMALIGNRENEDLNVEWICGGSLISNQYVLSAAHCNDPANSLVVPTWVLLGERRRPDQRTKIGPGQRRGHLFRIEHRMNHPKYKPPQQDNDIALFKLESPVTLGPNIRPVCLALPADSLATTTRVLATGWGRTAADEVESDFLLKVVIDRLQDSMCVQAYKDDETTFRNGFDAKTMMCAGRLNETKDTCQGDSGGPLHSKVAKEQNKEDYKCMWLQEGITSLGSSYCGDGTPAVYTKVSSFLSWIQPIVWPAQDLKFA